MASVYSVKVSSGWRWFGNCLCKSFFRM